MYNGEREETRLTADSLLFELCGGKPYMSPVLDSGSCDTVWGRMVLKTSDGARVSISVRIGNDRSLTDACVIKSKYTDCLLYTSGASGRFLQFTVEGTGSLYGYKIYYPKIDFTKYLPALYSGNEQLERFLSVFSESYADFEREIDQFEKELNPIDCKEENLAVLAGIIGGELFLAAETTARRRLLRHAGLLYQWRGTANAVRLAVYLASGEMPAVIEREGFVDIMLTACDSKHLPVIKNIARQFVPYPLGIEFVFPAKDAMLEKNGYLDYCRLAERKQAVLGRAVLGEMVCL